MCRMWPLPGARAGSGCVCGGAFALGTSRWWQLPHDHRCPHDGWLESFTVSEVPGAEDGESITTIRTRLLAAYHDGHIELFYPRVFSYQIQSPSCVRGLGDCGSTTSSRCHPTATSFTRLSGLASLMRRVHVGLSRHLILSFSGYQNDETVFVLLHGFVPPNRCGCLESPGKSAVAADLAGAVHDDAGSLEGWPSQTSV